MQVLATLPWLPPPPATSQAFPSRGLRSSSPKVPVAQAHPSPDPPWRSLRTTCPPALRAPLAPLLLVFLFPLECPLQGQARFSYPCAVTAGVGDSARVCPDECVAWHSACPAFEHQPASPTAWARGRLLSLPPCPSHTLPLSTLTSRLARLSPQPASQAGSHLDLSAVWPGCPL